MITRKQLIMIPSEIRSKFRVMGDLDEANYLYHMAARGGNILEIGTGPGYSALLMAQAMETFKVPGKVYTIGWEADPADAARTLERFAVYPELMKRVNHCTQKSEEVFQNYKDEDFDFVYVDGDHSYEGVKKDIKNFKSKVSKHGILAFHDTNQEQVMRAIEECLPWNLVYAINRIKGYSNPATN